MIDIMFFLLVFFIMLAMRMIPSSGLVRHLPTSSTAAALPSTKVLVEIHPEGLLVDEVPMSPAALGEKLRQVASARTVVTIAGAATASLQQLAQVMDICHENGITQIGLATQNVQ
jgi:biopolymer transport protein ExbD